MTVLFVLGVWVTVGTVLAFLLGPWLKGRA